MSRRHSPTSKAAHDSVKAHKSEMYDKIREGLIKLRVGGNFETIAIASGITPAQCHKRLPEMIALGIVYNVGITHPTSSGRKAMVRQLTELNFPNTVIRKATEPSDYVQQDLFPE